jgi:hypothetical protein
MVLQGIPARPLNGAPHCGLPCGAAEDAVSEAGDVEGGAPVTVTVLAQVEVVADSMQSDHQQADAAPVVEPAVGQCHLRRVGLDEHGGERGSEASSGCHGTSRWNHPMATAMMASHRSIMVMVDVLPSAALSPPRAPTLDVTAGDLAGAYYSRLNGVRGRWGRD